MAALHADSVSDVATSSNFKQIRTTQIHLDLDVNFDRKIISGVERITFKVLQNGIREVLLDIHQTMTITSVTVDHYSTEEVTFSIVPFTGYGETLRIQLSGKELVRESLLCIQVEYVATGGPGVSWLEPEQTEGKEKPYLYTQGQAVMNRSFFPCQDTPAVKAPYTANVKVPPGFVAVMSASERSHGQVANLSGDKDNFFFRMKQPVASYLIALAVGDIVSAEIGPRSHVWAEPKLLAAAQAEFDGEVEKFLQTGENLFGAYQWERYDLLVMPPSFPFGGMENPCLTFVTPCIVVGDKSLTDVVIHEISHSWFGNLVTNANWSEFWLNEGFTMFAQRRITEKLFGRATMCLEANTHQTLLRQHMENTGMDHPLNRLRVVIEKGVDPDDTYNETPYEKGFAFVCYLQSLAGDVHVFDEFLKAYVAKFQFKSVVAEDMFDFFFEYFPQLKEQNVAEREGFEFSQWLNKSGWPPYDPDLSAAHELTDPPEDFVKNITHLEPSQWPDIGGWTVYQVLHLLDRLEEHDDLSASLLQAFSKTYPRISTSRNAEIRLRWCRLIIKNDFQDEFQEVVDFLESQGKQKYTLPVYRTLVRGSPNARQLAHRVFEQTKHKLHISVKNYVQKILDESN